MKKYLYDLVLNENTKKAKIFNLFIIFLIVLSIISFSIESVPDLDHDVINYLRFLEIFTVVVFSIEYVLRLSLGERPIKYFFSFYGIVDLLAIAPFYISLGIDLRSIRIIRVFRVFRIFKVARYSKAIQRYKVAFGMIKEELIIFLVAALLLIYISALGIYYFENEAQPEIFSSVFDSLWWAVVTFTTIGYGDVFPITMGGRFFTAIIVIIGLGIISVPTGLIASALTKAVHLEDEHKNNN